MAAVKYLLENGAFLDSKDVSGHTALSEARGQNHTQIMNLLEAKRRM